MAGKLLFTKGNFLLATQHTDASNGYAILVPSSVIIEGVGRSATDLRCGVADTSVLYNRAGSDITIRSLKVNGNALANNADCIKFLNTARVNITDVDAAAARMGVQLLGCTDVSLVSVYAHNQVQDSEANDARCFSIGDDDTYTGTARVQLLHCRAASSADHGFAIFTNASDVQLIGCHALSNSATGFRLATSVIAELVGCWSRSNVTGFHLVACSELTVTACHAFSNSQHGFNLAGTTNSSFTSCEARNNGTSAANTYDGIYVADNSGTGSTGNTFVACVSRNTGGTGQKYGYNSAGANSGNNVIESCNFQNNQTAPGVFASTDIKRNNYGYKTENNGTGAIANGATTAVITHGLGVTPAAKDITITPTNAPTNAPGHIYVDTFTSTQFTVHCTNDPGASTLTFAWHATVL